MFYWYSQSTSQKFTTRRARAAFPLFLCPPSLVPGTAQPLPGAPGAQRNAAPAWGSMQQGCSRSGRYRAGLLPVASDGRGELRPAAAMCRQQERLPRAPRGPAPAQGRPAVRMAPLEPRAQRRGAAAAPAPGPRRRPSGGGWRGPAWRRSCPDTTPAGDRASGGGGHPACDPRLWAPCPAHLAAREQPVVEVADTVAEAELGHAVVDQQEVPQLGSRRGSHQADRSGTPREFRRAPRPARDARVLSRAPPVLPRTRHLKVPWPGHAGTRHPTDSPGTTHDGLGGHAAPSPPPPARGSRCGAAAGARPPGPSRALAGPGPSAPAGPPAELPVRHFRSAQR